MKLSDQFINRIKEVLEPLNIEKIILFGSYARGEGNNESDIDLYVVTKDQDIPANWHEKNELYLKISREIRALRSEIPIDLIVHTMGMNKKFIEIDSQFSREIIENGIRIL